MTSLTVVGGIYHESCVWPEWDQVYGSAGRAAVAVSALMEKVSLVGYAAEAIEGRFKPVAALNGIALDAFSTEQAISFDYFHSLSIPRITPAISRINKLEALKVSADVVLRFGMLETSAIVHADWCVYDPQSAFSPEPFLENGSKARHLAIVANRGEVRLLTNEADPIAGAKRLIAQGVEVVVVKAGVCGAYVIDANAVSRVPPYITTNVWTIGSGDVFAAVFAALWGAGKNEATSAADAASKAVASYVGSMALPVPLVKDLHQLPLKSADYKERLIYLAAPFFSLSQRWVVDETRRCLKELGMRVISPVHDIGPGEAADVVPADLKAIENCDAIFSILDGLDSGTLYEVGYARAQGKPVYALSQTVSDEDLKMVVGSGCQIFDDFVTAVHHTAWGT